MDKQDLLDGKRILIVDDEPDVLDTLEDLLTMCRTTKAATFEQAKALLEDQYFDMAILDIMEKGKSLWWRWYDRLANHFEKKFGPDWQKDHGFKVR